MAQEPFLGLIAGLGVIVKRATTSAIHRDGVTVDFTLEMVGFDFETVAGEHRVFRVEGIEIPVARLAHVVESKSRVNRPKDRLFLEIYRERLQTMLDDDEG